MDDFTDSVLSVGHEGSLGPSKDVKCDVPEPKKAKGDPEIDTKSVEDPAGVPQTFGRLVVVGEEEVVGEGDGEPDQVGAEEEECASDQLDPPAGGSHELGLGGHARGLVLARCGVRRLYETNSPCQPRPGFQRRSHWAQFLPVLQV